MSRIRLEDIDRLFQYNMYLGTNTLYIGSVGMDEGDEPGVDFKMAEYAIKGLHVLDSKSPGGTSPFNIIMNNPGGDVYHGLAIYDAIAACKNHITIQVYGQASSMGSVILQAGDTRLMSKNSVMLIHKGTSGIDSIHTEDFIRAADEDRRLNILVEDIYMSVILQKKPRFTRKKLRDMLSNDTYLTASQAIELGLCDGYLEEHNAS